MNMKIEIDIDDDGVPDAVAEIDLKAVKRALWIKLLPYLGGGSVLACFLVIG